MSEEHFIPGIYNYCDQWCERCSFITRCRTYQYTTAHHSPEQTDISNEKFWDSISGNFHQAIELLQRAAEEHGYDINSVLKEELEAAGKKEEDIKARLKQHPLTVMCKTYRSECSGLFNQTDLLREESQELAKQVEMGISTEEAAYQVINEMNGYLELIHRYMTFIYVKFMRALHGKMEDDGWFKENGFQNDFDGCAKIAVIACERSIAAWSGLLNRLLQREDEIIFLLSILQKICHLAEEEFPDYKTFIRPGFDEIRN